MGNFHEGTIGFDADDAYRNGCTRALPYERLAERALEELGRGEYLPRHLETEVAGAERFRSTG